MNPASTVHASAVRVGAIGVLIRGPSGAGKSRLAFDLILAGRAGLVATTRLVGDDRVYLSAAAGGVTVRAAAELAGLIEIRGLGIRRCECVADAVVGLVVDLAAEDAGRLPAAHALTATINGIEIPRIPVGAGFSAIRLVVGFLTTTFPS